MIRRSCCLPGIYFLAFTASIGWAQFSLPASDPAQQKPSGPAQLEDFVRRLGPLKIREQSFAVVLHKKRVRVARAVGSEETVERMEIRDETGNVLYEKTFPYEVEEDHFAETREIGAQVLEGNQGSGILVTFEVEPSTPLGGTSYQAFGLFNGKLVPFSQPLSMEGNLIQPESPPENVVKVSSQQGLEGDVLRFRVWTGNVFVIIPAQVDWLQAKMRPALPCSKTTAHGELPVCRFSVEADPRPPERELSDVRLYPEAGEEKGPPQQFAIKKSSKVEILEAEGELLWQEGEEQVTLKVAEDLWLKVRIDAKEGWIHSQTDFTAIGLPQAE